LGEVIQDAYADHSAADHHHPRIALHGPSSYITRWTPPAAPAELRSPRPCRSARSATSGTARWPYRPVARGAHRLTVRVLSAATARARNAASPLQAHAAAHGNGSRHHR